MAIQSRDLPATATWWQIGDDGRVELIPPGQPRQEWVDMGQSIVDDVTEALGGMVTFVTSTASGPGLNWGTIEGQQGSYTISNATSEMVAINTGRREPRGRPAVEVQWNEQYNPREDIRRAIDEIYGFRPYAPTVEALEKSKALLYSFLSPDQIKELEERGKGFFTLITQSGGKYRINTNTSYNVKMWDRERRKWIGLCAIPAPRLPIYDIMLTQMLALQTNEAGFLRVANRDTMYGFDYFEQRHRWGEPGVRLENLPRIEWVE